MNAPFPLHLVAKNDLRDVTHPDIFVGIAVAAAESNMSLTHKLHQNILQAHQISLFDIASKVDSVFSTTKNNNVPSHPITFVAQQDNGGDNNNVRHIPDIPDIPDSLEKAIEDAVSRAVDKVFEKRFAERFREAFDAAIEHRFEGTTDSSSDSSSDSSDSSDSDDDQDDDDDFLVDDDVDEISTDDDEDDEEDDDEDDDDEDEEDEDEDEDKIPRSVVTMRQQLQLMHSMLKSLQGVNGIQRGTEQTTTPIVNAEDAEEVEDAEEKQVVENKTSQEDSS